MEKETALRLRNKVSRRNFKDKLYKKVIIKWMTKLTIRIRRTLCVPKRDAQTCISLYTLWKDTLQAATTPSENLFAMYVGKDLRSTSISRSMKVYILVQNHSNARFMVVMLPLHKPGSFLHIRRCTKWKSFRSQRSSRDSKLLLRSVRLAFLWNTCIIHA